MPKDQSQEMNELKEQLAMHIEEETKLLKELLTTARSNHMDKYAKVVQVSLYGLAMVIGIGVSWGVLSTKLAAAETAAQKVTVLESRVRDMEIKQAGEEEILKSIKSDVTEIKDDLKKLTKSQ